MPWWVVLLCVSAAAPPPAPTAPRDGLVLLDRSKESPAVDAPPVVNSYTLLRTSTDRVGQASQQVVEVAGNLQELKEDLQREYSKWEHRKQDAATEREHMEAEIAQLRAELARQSKLREEVLRLRADRESLVQQLHAAYEQGTEAYTRWESQRKEMQDQIQASEAKLESAHEERAKRTSDARSRAEEVQRKLTSVKCHFQDLTEQARKQEDVILQEKIESKKVQDELLLHAEELREQGRHVRRELISQAQLRVQKRRVDEQAGKVVSLREQTQAEWTACTQRLQQIGAQIVDAQHVLADANKQVAQCQAVDAENQALLERANRCRAAGRPPFAYAPYAVASVASAPS